MKEVQKGQTVFWRGDTGRNFPHLVAGVFADRIYVREGKMAGVMVTKKSFKKRYLIAGRF